MRNLLLILALAVCTSFLACGGDEDDGGEDNSVSALGEEITAAHCGRIFSCCNAEERANAFGGIPVGNEEECLASVEGIIQVNVVPPYQAAVDAETVTYDPSGIQGCIEGLNRVACDSFEPDPRFAISEIPGCRGLFDPQLETTEFCTEDFECKSGFCAISASGEEGTCAEEPEDGEACIANRCAFGLYCDEGTCTARNPEDFACEFDDQCESRNCVDVSAPEDPSELRCRPLPAACGG